MSETKITINRTLVGVLALGEGAHSGPLKLRTGAYGVVEVLPGRGPRLLEWDIRPASSVSGERKTQ